MCPAFEAEVDSVNKFETVSLTAICAQCNKDMDVWFTPVISQLLVALSTMYLKPLPMFIVIVRLTNEYW